LDFNKLQLAIANPFEINLNLIKIYLLHIFLSDRLVSSRASKREFILQTNLLKDITQKYNRKGALSTGTDVVPDVATSGSKHLGHMLILPK
jgi:hypothetical protein